MTRKLCSVLLCACALLLLMGAGTVPQQSDSLLIEEESVRDEVLTLDMQSAYEANDGFLPAAVGVSPIKLAENTDDSFLIDGAPAHADLGKTVIDGVTYVALAPMARALDPEVQIHWDADAGVVTVATAQLHLVAEVGQLYLEANGRYLYIPEGIQLVDGRVTVPLWAVAKAFDAVVGWDATTEVVTVDSGSGAIDHADEYYDEEILFWLSRVIYAESGNQPLEGQMAVGNVVMNRLENPIYPDSIEGVLAQKNQFTTYNNGKLANRTPNESSVLAAKLVMDGGEVEETLGALYFNTGVRGWVARNRECVAVIGNHTFYR